MNTPTQNAEQMLDCLESEIDEAILSVLGSSPSGDRLSEWVKTIFKNTRDSVEERMTCH